MPTLTERDPSSALPGDRGGVVQVLLYDGWADWEIGHLIARIQNPAWQRDPGAFRIQTVAETSAPVRSMGGLTVVPDVTAAAISPASSAMLVLPGSSGFDTGNIPWATDLAAQFLRAGVPVAAICGATAGLAKAGLLDDRHHTSAVPQYLAATGYSGGERYVDEEVVSDRGLITAGPVDALPFAREALSVLGVFEPHVLDAWYRVFTEHDAAAFGVLASAGAANAAAEAEH